jgi:hypothetical protein
VVATGKLSRPRQPTAFQNIPALVVLAASVALATITASGPDYLRWRAAQLANGESWGAVEWESRHLPAALQLVLAQVTSPPDIEAIRTELPRLLQSPRGTDLTPPAVQRTLAAAVTEQLRAGGVPALGGAVFPPVAFTVTEPPFVLVISPRAQIRLAEAVLLDERISPDRAEALEASVERLNLSVLVEQTGGLAAYPTLIAPETNAYRALQTIAHEWTHTALFFTPLGRAYGASAEAQALNETTADLVGQEIALRAAEAVGERPQASAAAPDRALTDTLRRIRVNADQLLAQGDIADAEAYMEQERQTLVAQGYAFRRLNQAYFAFHGNYAEGPAASTEIPDSLRALRAESGTLNAFIGRVGRITSLAELKQLVGR